jgi:hypothetical protein
MEQMMEEWMTKMDARREAGWEAEKRKMEARREAEKREMESSEAEYIWPGWKTLRPSGEPGDASWMPTYERGWPT